MMEGIPLDLLIEISENRHRKDYTLSEIREIKIKIEPYIKKTAEKRRKDTEGRPKKKKEKTGGKLPPVSKTRDIIADYVGVSGRTLDKIDKIFEVVKKYPDICAPILEKAESGDISIHRAFKLVIIKERQQDSKERGSPPLPDGVYDVIYADPPWQHGHGGSVRGKADSHYPTIPTDEICLLPIQTKIAEDAALFLWATNPMIEDALRVASEWGFKYKTNICWTKDKIGTGWYVRGQHELLLICIKKGIGTPADEDRPPSVIVAPRKAHSEKPKKVYNIIENMYPNRKYIELFARGIKPREGWTYWGDEVG